MSPVTKLGARSLPEPNGTRRTKPMRRAATERDVRLPISTPSFDGCDTGQWPTRARWRKRRGSRGGPEPPIPPPPTPWPENGSLAAARPTATRPATSPVLAKPPTRDGDVLDASRSSQFVNNSGAITLNTPFARPGHFHVVYFSSLNYPSQAAIVDHGWYAITTCDGRAGCRDDLREPTAGTPGQRSSSAGGALG